MTGDDRRRMNIEFMAVRVAVLLAFIFQLVILAKVHEILDLLKGG